MKKLFALLLLFCAVSTSYATDPDTVTISSVKTSAVNKVQFKTRYAGSIVLPTQDPYALYNYHVEYAEDTIYLVRSDGANAGKYPTAKFYFRGGNTQDNVNAINWQYFTPSVGDVLVLTTTERDSFILHTSMKHPLIYNSTTGFFEVWDGEIWRNED